MEVNPAREKKIKYAGWLLCLAIVVVACVLLALFSDQARAPCFFIYAVVVLALAWLLKDAFNLMSQGPQPEPVTQEKALQERKIQEPPAVQKQSETQAKPAAQKTKPVEAQAKAASQPKPETRARKSGRAAPKKIAEVESEYDYDG